jgi:hypothetical protein
MATHHIAIHHIDTTAGPMDSGSAAIIKNRKRIRAEARGSGGASDYVASASGLRTNVAHVYILMYYGHPPRYHRRYF